MRTRHSFHYSKFNFREKKLVLTSFSPRSEDPLITQEKGLALAADKTLATQRLKAFIADNALCLVYEYGSTTTAQARHRMEEKLKEFEKDFNKTNSTKEVGDSETYIQRYEED